MNVLDLASRLVEGPKGDSVVVWSQPNQRLAGGEWRNVYLDDIDASGRVVGREPIAIVKGRINTVVIMKAIAASFISVQAEIRWPEGGENAV